MTNELIQRVEAAETIIRQAGEMALGYFSSLKQLTIVSKGLQDRVSEADRNVEQMIRDALLEQFPGDGFLGEETGSSDELENKQYIWVNDPIDGTDNFVYGIPVWCISIALLSAGEVQAGLILNPNAHEMFVGVRGQGATCNGEPIRVSSAGSVTGGVTAMGFSHRRPPEPTLEALDALVKAGGVFQRNGSAALTLAYVAGGRYIGFFEAHINSWDVLAGLLLVEEAGGWSNDFLANDGLHHGNPVVSGAPGIEAEFRRICAPLLRD